MRISDWSSDVCSSDLRRRHGPLVRLFDWLTTLPPDEAARHRGDILATAMLSPFALLTSSLGILMMSLLAMLFTQAPWATAWFVADVLLLGARFALAWRSEEHTSELQSLMRTSYAVFCLKKKNE